MRDWLREARLEKGMTMKELGEKVGLSESYYCYIEKGQRQRNLELDLAGRLSRELGLSLKQILQEEDAWKEKGE